MTNGQGKKKFEYKGGKIANISPSQKRSDRLVDKSNNHGAALGVQVNMNPRIPRKREHFSKKTEKVQLKGGVRGKTLTITQHFIEGRKKIVIRGGGNPERGGTRTGRAEK